MPRRFAAVVVDLQPAVQKPAPLLIPPKRRDQFPAIASTSAARSVPTTEDAQETALRNTAH